MSKARNIQVQTPGEPLREPEPQPTPSEPEADASTESKAETANTASETLQAQTQTSESGELPDADTIDASTLDRPLLTKQGYLLPEKK